MDIKKLILKQLNKEKELKVSKIIKETGFSREYLTRFFRELRNEGKIILIGKGRGSYYILANKESLDNIKKQILNIKFVLKNKNLSEDLVLKKIKKETGIFFNLPDNIDQIITYAFLEMTNNAIEHSKSEQIKISMENRGDLIIFNVKDSGIGIFNNIMQKKELNNTLEAIQDLLKGKQTTMSSGHSGEGIFFTSKVASNFIIRSSDKELLFNNKLDDVFISDLKNVKGTEIIFTILLNSLTKIKDIFDEYSNNDYEFDKTKVHVKLYKVDADYISRSQARRILVGLEKFKIIILDFKVVETVGQAFADEIFRVWQKNHPQIKFQVINSNENINFMIKRAKV